MRAVASRTAAILLARTALSTTSRRCAQDAGRAPLLDGLEVEIVENGAGFARRQRLVVALDDHATIAEDPVGEGSRRLVEQHEIDGTAGGRLEPGGEGAECLRVPRRARTERDGEIDITIRALITAGRRAEYERVQNVVFGLENASNHLQHAVRVSRRSGNPSVGRARISGGRSPCGRIRAAFAGAPSR